eukprot:SAG31_NODE_728_length_12522_cov_13.320534_10_plen_143_part_00
MGYRRGTHRDVTTNKLKHPIGPNCGNAAPVGSFIQGRAKDKSADPFWVCVDSGSSGTPCSITGYVDVRLCVALGLRIDTSHRVKVATAGSDGKETVHQTIGTTRFNLSIGNCLEGREDAVRVERDGTQVSSRECHTLWSLSC